ncbi:MAG: enoyl-CoA hydratase/isomerase family protein [Candidatus Heimdallarchaeota archaeon]
MSTYETVIVSKEGSFLAPEPNIAVVKLSRPEALNAFNDQLMTDLEAAFKEIEQDESIRAVVITAEGEKAFSAGADLKQASTVSPEEATNQAAALVEKGQRVFKYIENFPKPTICAINGLALGGGLEISLCCDLRVASKEAKMGNPEVMIGLIPSWGGCDRLPRLVGLSKAKEIVLTGGMITADQAEKIGLVNKLVPPDELQSTAMFMAQKLADNAPVAMRLAKQVLNKSLDHDLDAGLALERDATVECFKTEDIQEGIKAVFEKRKAQFKGR